MIPSKVLSVPFLIMAGLGFYLASEVDSRWSIMLLLSILILVALYVYDPAINWWWWNRYPPELDPELTKALEQRSRFYRKLTEEQQSVFRRRIFFFRHGNDFKPQGMDKSPDDIEMMIAIAPVAMTLHQEAFLFPDFENIIIYGHPFPSPQYETTFHASEIYEPDGVIMFCATHVARGFLEPHIYLNLAWYEYAKIYLLKYPTPELEGLKNISWEDLETISRFSEEALQRWIGLENLDVEAMALAFYFLFPDSFEDLLPEIHQSLDVVFRLDK